MRELNKKVFKTIFLMLSTFILLGIVIYNVVVYKKEYDNIRRNLTFIEDRNMPDDKLPDPKKIDSSIHSPRNRDLDNMMIMDYEVYTIKLNNKKINDIINHSNVISDFDVQSIVNKIVNNGEGLRVGNLYNNKCSYNYISDTIVIINTRSINNRLIFTLIESIIILLVFELIIYYVSKKMTKRITKPASDAFDKQRDFIADASHELKTPLAIIMASSDEIKTDKKNLKYVDNIKYESERMNYLIKNLLDLSKIENGISNGNYKEENISKIIEKTCLIFEGIAFENNVIIDTDIEKDIMFKCNKDEIERLISIILDNAIKHSYKDSKIVVNVNNNKGNINIEIINTGDPIKHGDKEKIFERFYRADKSRNRNSNRYGLGLAIARSIVYNHNGIIKASSSGGKTIFKIKLKK